MSLGKNFKIDCNEEINKYKRHESSICYIYIRVSEKRFTWFVGFRTFRSPTFTWAAMEKYSTVMEM